MSIQYIIYMYVCSRHTKMTLKMQNHNMENYHAGGYFSMSSLLEVRLVRRACHRSINNKQKCSDLPKLQVMGCSIMFNVQFIRVLLQELCFSKLGSYAEILI